jgi:hypothetical protein
MIDKVAAFINLKGSADFRLFSFQNKQFKAIDNEETIAATF